MCAVQDIRAEARRQSAVRRREKLVVLLKAAQGADVRTVAHLIDVALELAEEIRAEMED